MVSLSENVDGNNLQVVPAQTEDSSPSKQTTSILSLTLDEIQCKSGKSVGSMNMDEFLASIWTVEESQPDSGGGGSKSTTPPPPAGPISALRRQASFSIPTYLCNKTVDEVWYEIHKDHPPPAMPPTSRLGCSSQEPPRRQQTFGEMTLEDFLVKAGVVQEPHQRDLITSIFQKLPPGNGSGFGMGTNFAGYALAAGTGSGMVVDSHLGNGFGNGYLMYPHSGDPSSCNVFNEVPSGFKARRIIDGPPEVVVERRQRRMIKNRESAARSRARKQAYTVELEVELNQLKEENEKLKKILEEFEQKRKHEVLMKRKQVTFKGGKAAEKILSMRRAMSLSW